MRIIAGTKRGLKLFSPETQESRPITDRVKESLFSVLYKYDLPAGAVVGDLFSGVGSLGLEALSRGAEFVTFVERDPETAGILEKNIAKADFAERSKVVRSDAFLLALPGDSNSGRYNLVFIDPPYAATREVGEGSALSGLLEVLGGQVASGCIVTVRTHARMVLADEYGRFEVVDRRRWGSMVVAILRSGDE
ncbi:MAG: RsmD family RNA methyltransferase [Sedimentisphaerales bacterium]|nr:RsmD family RNA methyltransferase [Sedimentisphaerales bacterium]